MCIDYFVQVEFMSELVKGICDVVDIIMLRLNLQALSMEELKDYGLNVTKAIRKTKVKNKLLTHEKKIIN